METLSLLYSVDSRGKGSQKALRFHEDHILCPTDGKIAICRHDTLITEVKLPGYAYFLDWAIPLKRLWVCGESGLHSICIIVERNNKKGINVADHEDPETYQINFHDMTCCGIDLDPTTGYIAVGDFAGNVIIWNEMSHAPLYQTTIFSAIRYDMYYYLLILKDHFVGVLIKLYK
jgi:hypothetical protein